MILCPATILEPQPLHLAVTGLISVVVVLVATQVLLCNHYLTVITQFERVIWFLIGVVLIGFMIIQNYVLFAVGLIGFILLTVRQVKQERSMAH
jgi:hypothetical protein